MTAFRCELVAQYPYNHARVMRLTTAHGEVLTPVFMPVGTRAGVNNLTPQELLASKTQMILGGNTYHMLCAPGLKVIERAGGMHPFMGWHGPMLTDSGGFQVFSLADCRIDEKGAHFRISETDWIHMTPEVSLQTQKIIGADLIMAFDQCTPDHCSLEEAKQVMQRTHRWLLQSLNYHHAHPNTVYGYPQALFGIIQGGVYERLRQESAAFVSSLDLDGIALGGESIGADMKRTKEIIHWILDLLPLNKPRYTMGLGMSPQDLLDVVALGIDLFDCVAPTRNARHGALYCGELVSEGQWLRFISDFPDARLQIKKSCFAQDFSPIMPSCACFTCKHYTRSALHHLLKQKAAVFTALASIHNIHVLHEVCARMRSLILNLERNRREHGCN
jgi:queuine tRNA-ribosyltransferase